MIIWAQKYGVGDYVRFIDHLPNGTLCIVEAIQDDKLLIVRRADNGFRWMSVNPRDLAPRMI